MRRLNLLFWACAGSFFVFPAAAADWTEEGDNIISLYAQACEAVKPGEPKSSIRLRATDKASYKAVEQIAELSDYRNSFSGHDFNVLVYHLVDNYIEDLASRTIEQNEAKICVEVTGYLNSENIIKALNENHERFELSAREADEENLPEVPEYPDSLDVETQQPLQPAVNDLPPKPAPVISKEIAAETVLTADADGRPTVYIADTEFFNNTKTASFYDEIKNVLSEKQDIFVVGETVPADYTIRAKVLRAKVDPINKQTNRLQMVIAVELTDNADGSSVVEHQNRFLLFESTDNEQAVAGGLMKKLLRKAVGQIAGYIKSGDSGNQNAIITPAAPTFRR